MDVPQYATPNVAGLIKTFNSMENMAVDWTLQEDMTFAVPDNYTWMTEGAWMGYPKHRKENLITVQALARKVFQELNNFVRAAKSEELETIVNSVKAIESAFYKAKIGLVTLQSFKENYSFNSTTRVNKLCSQIMLFKDQILDEIIGIQQGIKSHQELLSTKQALHTSQIENGFRNSTIDQKNVIPPNTAKKQVDIKAASDGKMQRGSPPQLPAMKLPTRSIESTKVKIEITLSNSSLNVTELERGKAGLKKVDDKKVQDKKVDRQKDVMFTDMELALSSRRSDLAPQESTSKSSDSWSD